MVHDSALAVNEQMFAEGETEFSSTTAGNASRMFTYRLHTPLGEEIGEATHRFLIEPGEVLTVGDNQRFRVIEATDAQKIQSDSGGKPIQCGFSAGGLTDQTRMRRSPAAWNR